MIKKTKVTKINDILNEQLGLRNDRGITQVGSTFHIASEDEGIRFEFTAISPNWEKELVNYLKLTKQNTP
ncbi:hypothetical protein [Terasakiella sp.]|uniref:hypothetical protein n=1 Tax=Terasakiella sp. TaxID=2034861 RepID=UPI003AA83D6F